MRILKAKPISQRVKTSLVIAASAVCTISPAQAKLYAFGDSYSDNGNFSIVTSGSQPGPQYYQGRFSNGPTWAEVLSQRLFGSGLGFAPSLASIQIPSGVNGGVDFAHAGSTAANVRIQNYRYVQNQVSFFRGRSGSLGVTRNDVASVFAGVNDYLVYNTTVNATVTGVYNAVSSLSRSGVGRILVFNLHNMGDMPGYYDSASRTQLNDTTASHNRLLETQLSTLRSRTTVKIISVDVNRAISLASQGVGGFNITHSGQNGSQSGSCVDDGKFLSACTDNYLYYDFAHFSAAGHRYLAGIAYDRLMSVTAGTAQAGLSAATTTQALTKQNNALALRLAAASEGQGGVMNFADVGVAEFGATQAGFGASMTGGRAQSQGLSVYGFGDQMIDDSSLAETNLRDEPAERQGGFGADWREGQFLAGAAFFRGTDSEDTFGDANFQSKSTTTGASIYGAYFGKDVRVDLSGTFTDGTQEFRRFTAIEALPLVTGQTDIKASSVSLGAYYDFKVGMVDFTADARLTYARSMTDGFQESGTLGLSDNYYEASDVSGAAGRAGLTASIKGESIGGSLSVHYLASLDSDARFDLAAPFTMASFGAAPRSKLVLDEQQSTARDGAAVWGSVWIADQDNFALRADAGALVSGEGVDSGVMLTGTYKF